MRRFELKLGSVDAQQQLLVLLVGGLQKLSPRPSEGAVLERAPVLLADPVAVAVAVALLPGQGRSGIHTFMNRNK